MALKAQHKLVKGLRSPKKFNIQNDDEKDLKNLQKIDLMDFAKDQVPEATEPISTTTVHENCGAIIIWIGRSPFATQNS